MPLTEFSKNKGRKGGYNHLCKACAAKAWQMYYATHSTHPKRNCITGPEDERNRDKAAKRKYRQSFQGTAKTKEYKQNRAHDPVAHEKDRIAQLAYRHRPDINARSNAMVRHRRKTDPHFRFACAIRSTMRGALKRNSKASSSEVLLGCSIMEVRAYLETKFTAGMTWANYGRHGWHVDHIIPCAAFDLSKPDQQRTCFHYTNLQPLWERDNMRKKDKLNWKPAT